MYGSSSVSLTYVGALNRRDTSRPLRTSVAWLLVGPRSWIPLAPPMYEPSNPTKRRVPNANRTSHEPPVPVASRAALSVKSVTPPPAMIDIPKLLAGAHRCGPGGTVSLSVGASALAGQKQLPPE